MKTSQRLVYNSIERLVIRKRRIVISLFLLVQAALANYLAFILRHDSILKYEDLGEFLRFLPLVVAVRMLLYLKAGLYKSLWRYASVEDLVKIIKTSTMGSLILLVSIRYLFGDVNYPRSVYLLDWALFILIAGGTRLLLRIFREYMRHEPGLKRVLIIGASDAGEMLVREIKGNPMHGYEPVGFIDEDPYKKGLTIHGVPIFGKYNAIPKVISRYKPDEVLVAASNGNLKNIYDLCKPFNVSVKKLPRLSDILDGNISVSAKLGQLLVEANMVTGAQVHEALEYQRKEGGRFGAKLIKLGYISEEHLVSFLNKQFRVSQIKPLQLEDLLQREPVRTDIKLLRDFIEGKSVLVTGAGGSIGSELCRQIVKYDPSVLVMLDRYENSLFYVDRELREAAPGANIKTVICDIQDRHGLEKLFAACTPGIVFHSAAYKHVPLMEHNPVEAAKNNIFGTSNLLETSRKYEADSFVTISTDKAVNPTSIMGATKRVAELLTINMNSASRKTKFTAVRFGNVLGTNGSVVPIFRRQLQKGGPLTVTHPEMKRFFMLIPEAMQLVLIAAAAGRGGEIFVLDMGEQIKITDLAENLIRLSGFIPHEEIKIEFTGLRPGEKLYEELFNPDENILPTFHEKLRMAVSDVPAIHPHHLSELEGYVKEMSVEGVIGWIRTFVPRYKPQPAAGQEAVLTAKDLPVKA